MLAWTGGSRKRLRAKLLKPANIYAEASGVALQEVNCDISPAGQLATGGHDTTDTSPNRKIKQRFSQSKRDLISARMESEAPKYAVVVVSSVPSGQHSRVANLYKTKPEYVDSACQGKILTRCMH